MNEHKETVVFTREYNLQAGRLSRVEMREPTTADIRRALEASIPFGSDIEMRDIAKEQWLICNLTDLPPADLDALAACDYERLQIGLLILRADPDNRPKLRQEYAMGEVMPTGSSPATPEGAATLSEPDTTSAS